MQKMLNESVENTILKDAIYDQLKSMVENNEFPLNEKIDKGKLSRMFNVSPTPINDALNRLVGERYLVQKNRKGYFVREFDNKEFRDLFEMRAALEGVAARLTCERASDEELNKIVHMFDEFHEPVPESQKKDYVWTDMHFHFEILKASENTMILETAKSTGFMWRSYQKGLAKEVKTSMLEHADIIKALKVRNGVQAQELMTAHLLRSSKQFLC